jgi:hypothetical protein
VSGFLTAFKLGETTPFLDIVINGTGTISLVFSGDFGGPGTITDTGMGFTGTATTVPPRPATTDAVTAWNINAGKAALAACIEPRGSNDPFHESRLYAMVHVAIHDALNTIDRRFRPYVYRAHADPGASPDAAVAAAARDVLIPVIRKLPFSRACVQAGIASVEADYAAALAAILAGEARTQGVAIGQASAAAILANRARDGSKAPLLAFACPQGNNAGEFRLPPGSNFAAGASWANVTPFVLRHASQFRPRPPHRVGSEEYAADFNEVKSLGGDGANTLTLRTPEETEIALFWLESSPLAWNRIARSVSSHQSLDLWENARLFALLNLAIADGYIASMDTKYHYNFWRPVTAVHNADDDGNPDTVGDPSWIPFEANYPLPDYDSAHSVAGGAAAEVLEEFFGNDSINFQACSLTLPAGSRCTDPSPVLRTFSTFTHAAEENALSRIFAGLHFRDAVQQGVRHGRRIGNRTVKLFLRPAH